METIVFIPMMGYIFLLTMATCISALLSFRQTGGREGNKMVPESQKTPQKMCGNCLYYNYGKKRGEPTAECEVYSALHTAVDKPCTNWKEEKR